MFTMLAGSWCRRTLDGMDIGALETEIAAGRRPAAALDAAIDALVREVVLVQAAAGTGFVTDGHVRWADPSAAILGAITGGDTGGDGMLVRAWRATRSEAAAMAVDIPVAAAIVGPYTLGLRAVGPETVPGDGFAGREARTLILAGVLAGELASLEAEGCPLVVVEEPAAVGIGKDRAERTLFGAAQRRLLTGDGSPADLHSMLAVIGGSAADAGPDAVFGAPYRSYLFDLVEGPDNWRLVRAAPPERGIVCGAMRVAAAGGEDQIPLLVWAARYAESAGARGMERVGLANGTSLGGLEPAVARGALETLGRAAAFATMPLELAVEAGLDPRTVGSRMAALGPRAPRPPRRKGGRS